MRAWFTSQYRNSLTDIAKDLLRESCLTSQIYNLRVMRVLVTCLHLGNHMTISCQAKTNISFQKTAVFDDAENYFLKLTKMLLENDNGKKKKKKKIPFYLIY